MGFGVVFVLELRDETDVFFDVFSLLFHTSDIVGTFFLFDSSEHFLVFLDNSEELFFPEGFMEGSIETGGIDFLFFFMVDLEIGAFVA